MKRVFFLLNIAMCLAVGSIFAGSAAAPQSSESTAVKTRADNLLSTGISGTKFWLAVPPNESEQAAIETRALEIYVTSRFDTEVSISVPGLNLGPRRKPVKANEVTTFSDAASAGQDLSWAMEIRTSERVTSKGILLESLHPVVVYLFSAKRFSSEGYLALPVTAWDTSYIHCSYYDYPEPTINRGGGFIIIAQEDETEVSFRLRGTQTTGRTREGREIGQPYQFVLNEGDTYMVQGDGSDRAFDLTGTQIFADKAIGLISFHTRTIIPTSLGFDSRDFLAEMLPPTSSWGREYVTLELQRADRGDFFRIVALEDETEFMVEFFDLETKEIVGKRQGIINAGQLREYEEAKPGAGTESIRGAAVWKASKPVLLMQYAYSSGWDGSNEFDPFMVLATPVNNYVSSVNFSTPARSDVTTNWLNLLIKGDREDLEKTLLKSIKLDGMAIYRKEAKLLSNDIPDTDYFWLRLNLQPGAHELEGLAPFAGILYGSNQFESYSWPLSGIHSNRTADSSPPTLEQIDDRCASVDFRATELTVGPKDEVPQQVDFGIAAIELLPKSGTEDGSFNYVLQLLTDREIPQHELVESFDFRLRVVDVSRPAKAVFRVVDRAGNMTIDSVEYVPSLPFAAPYALSFGQVRVNRQLEQDVTIKNPTTETVTIQSITLAQGLEYQISKSPILPLNLAPQQEVSLSLRFAPREEVDNLDTPQRDSVMFGVASCGSYVAALIDGLGVLPHIHVADWNAGRVGIDKTICLDKGLPISNTGTDDLTISGIRGIRNGFALTNIDPEFPFTIAPGATVLLKTICFTPQTDGPAIIEVEFMSDAPIDDDNISIWRANGDGTTSVNEQRIPGLDLFVEGQNPAVNSTAVGLELPYPMRISIVVYSNLGRKIQTLADGNYPAGSHSFDIQLDRLPSGVYFIALQCDDCHSTRVVTIVR